MKYYLLLKLLVFFAFVVQVEAQSLSLSVTGHIYDIESGSPISNHNVLLNVTGNGLNDTYEFISNEDGFWGSDSLLAYNQGTVHAITYDCNGQIHEFQENYIPGSTTFVFDFYICSDTMPGGDCENWFLYEQLNDSAFLFHGESLPYPADFYSWNFGDGQSASGQDIFHTFDPVLSDSFLVQLTTIIINPAIGDSCFAISEQWISINGTSECQAEFYFFPDTLQPFIYHFYDNSTGSITHWLWDFGDGYSSTETNPEHSFAVPGSYNVCLTITSDSSGMYCADTHCEVINISAALIADFALILDTLTGLPGNYHFLDNSTGLPDSWSWDFGDGNNSSQQNPVHQFDESGTYEVCLLITKATPNGGTISDFHCEDLVVPNYFDIGGLVFIGNSPINNPISTGDTGVAFLYRKYEDAIVPVDTNYFYEYGYYWFSDVREGNHIVKVGLTENSEHFEEYAPSYFPDHIYWEAAEILLVEDTNNYAANVYLPELPGAPSGTGAIFGNIVDLPNPSLSDYVFYQPVFLYNASDELLVYQLSNVMGSYKFENLAFGTYKLVSDVTGFYGDPIIVTIDQANPVYYNAQLEIYETPPNQIPEFNSFGFVSGPVYPNPLTDKLNMDLEANRNLKLNAGIYNVLGQKIFENEIMIHEGSNILTISTEKLETGLYFITITSKVSTELNIYKFLKK